MPMVTGVIPIPADGQIPDADLMASIENQTIRSVDTATDLPAGLTEPGAFHWVVDRLELVAWTGTAWATITRGYYHDPTTTLAGQPILWQHQSAVTTRDYSAWSDPSLTAGISARNRGLNKAAGLAAPLRYDTSLLTATPATLPSTSSTATGWVLEVPTNDDYGFYVDADVTVQILAVGDGGAGADGWTIEASPSVRDTFREAIQLAGGGGGGGEVRDVAIDLRAGDYLMCQGSRPTGSGLHHSSITVAVLPGRGTGVTYDRTSTTRTDRWAGVDAATILAVVPGGNAPLATNPLRAELTHSGQGEPWIGCGAGASQSTRYLEDTPDPQNAGMLHPVIYPSQRPGDTASLVGDPHYTIADIRGKRGGRSQSPVWFTAGNRSPSRNRIGGAGGGGSMRQRGQTPPSSSDAASAIDGKEGGYVAGGRPVLLDPDYWGPKYPEVGHGGHAYKDIQVLMSGDPITVEHKGPVTYYDPPPYNTAPGAGGNGGSGHRTVTTAAPSGGTATTVAHVTPRTGRKGIVLIRYPHRGRALAPHTVDYT